MGAFAEKLKRVWSSAGMRGGWRVSSANNKEDEHQSLLNETLEQNDTPSCKTLYDLPLELLDIILQKSYLHWILNSATKQRDKEVFISLISVDVCFNRRIIRQRFKQAIWRHLKYLYRKTKKRSAIIRNNRNYLLENIQPNDELIASLLSHNCITEKQSHFIQRQLSNRVKNDELLNFLRSFQETTFSNLLKCLRRTNQKTVARIIENGGGVVKIGLKNRLAKTTTCTEIQQLHKHIEDLQNSVKPRSHRTDKLISKLKDEDLEILNSQMNRETLVVWIWCRSQAAIEYIRKLYETNQLSHVFFDFANIQPSTSEMINSTVINIDSNQFKNAIVLCPVSVHFTQRIDVGRHEYVYGVTKLRNEIYVLCRLYSSPASNIIRVFDDRNPFRIQQKIKITEIKSPIDIGSSGKENCLYVSDQRDKCVWKITRERDDEHKIMKWLTTDYQPCTLSVSTDCQLLMVNESSSSLMIYGSDAQLIRSIQLRRDIEILLRVVKTSVGNFIILHKWAKTKENSKSSPTGSERVMQCGILELSRDGQMIIHRFIASDKTQEIKNSFYLVLDSDDRVFVADQANGRVILLDSNLRWDRIICPTKQEDDEEQQQEDTKIRLSQRLCFDREKNQLIVGAFTRRDGVNVYILS